MDSVSTGEGVEVVAVGVVVWVVATDVVTGWVAVGWAAGTTVPVASPQAASNKVKRTARITNLVGYERIVFPDFLSVFPELDNFYLKITYSVSYYYNVLLDLKSQAEAVCFITIYLRVIKKQALFRSLLYR